MDRRIVGYRRKPLPIRPLTDYIVIGEGAHREVIFWDTREPENLIEPIYEGDEDDPASRL